MATIIEYDGKQFLLTVSYPEKEWIRELAHSMGITKEAIVGAAINKGLTHYMETFAETDEHDKAECHAEDKDKPDTGG